MPPVLIPPAVLVTLVSIASLIVTLAFANSCWVLAWVGLEINALAMLPLISQPANSHTLNPAPKYFLAQTTASVLILFATILNTWITGQWSLNMTSDPTALNVATLGLLIKLGIAPVHMWLPEVMKDIPLHSALPMATWQKLAPFTLLAQLTPHNYEVLVALGLLSVFIGGWGALKQLNLRKLMAYSSTAHWGCILLILQFSKPLALMTLLAYFLMTFSVFTLSNMWYAMASHALCISWSKVAPFSGLTPLIILCLGGHPPFDYHWPLWMLWWFPLMTSFGALTVLMTLYSLMSLLFYLRLSYAFVLLTPHDMKPSKTSRHLINLHITMRLLNTVIMGLITVYVLHNMWP